MFYLGNRKPEKIVSDKPLRISVKYEYEILHLKNLTRCPIYILRRGRYAFQGWIEQECLKLYQAVAASQKITFTAAT